MTRSLIKAFTLVIECRQDKYDREDALLTGHSSARRSARRMALVPFPLIGFVPAHRTLLNLPRSSARILVEIACLPWWNGTIRMRYPMALIDSLATEGVAVVEPKPYKVVRQHLR